MSDVLTSADAELHQRIVERRHSIDLLLAEEAVDLAEWDSRGVWASDNSRSPRHRLSRAASMSVPSAGRLVKRSRRLRDMPFILAAYCAGEISTDRVELLVEANQDDVAELFARDEQLLLNEIAKLRNFWEVRSLVQAWATMAADSLGIDRYKPHRNDGCSIATTFAGNVILRATFDPIGGEIIRNEHERLVDEMFAEDCAAYRAEHDGELELTELRRTPGERSKAAFVEMARRSSAMSNGAKPARPLISVTIDRLTFGKTLRLASGTEVSASYILPLLSEADIERIVYDGRSRVLDLGEQRAFVGAARRAIENRDKFCQHESGCDVPARLCHVDHIYAWSKGGKTRLSNGRLLCPFHNRQKSDGPAGFLGRPIGRPSVVDFRMNKLAQIFRANPPPDSWSVA